MSALHRLFYISRADEKIGHQHLGDLLPGARHHNATRGVTGILIFDGLHFAQVLEGPAPELLPLMTRIYGDDRHSEVNLLFFEPISERQYRSWALGYVYDDTLVDDVANLLALKVIDHTMAQQLADALVVRADQMA
ncbi:MAG: BLUF domain-containing protein [Comamonas sp.]